MLVLFVMKFFIFNIYCDFKKENKCFLSLLHFLLYTRNRGVSKFGDPLNIPMMK